jgi:hypothetical protein
VQASAIKAGMQANNFIVFGSLFVVQELRNGVAHYRIGVLLMPSVESFPLNGAIKDVTSSPRASIPQPSSQRRLESST